jgi:acetate kinase
MRTDDSILVLNCGSSSVKFAVYAADRLRAVALAASGAGASEAATARIRGQVAGLGGRPGAAHLEWRVAHDPVVTSLLPSVQSHQDAIDHLMEALERSAGLRGTLKVAGHRIVHGGGHFERPALLDNAAIAALEAQVPLAPLHQPHNLAGVRALAARQPDLPQIGCFDTAFHATQLPLHTTYALPIEMRERGVRRYGFHGLSYQFIADQLPAVAGPLADGRVIVAHLGNGASVCGMLERRSVRSSMGMTALDGLVMGTRPGSVDIGVALHAITALGMDADTLSHALYDRSGLLGLSGISHDVRTLLASTDPRAAFAIEVFCERAAQEIAATAVALGGCDLLVFTAGIGENSPPVRARIADRLAWMGVRLDRTFNESGAALVSDPSARVAVRVMPTDEESVIVSACLEHLARQG